MSNQGLLYLSSSFFSCILCKIILWKRIFVETNFFESSGMTLLCNYSMVEYCWFRNYRSDWYGVLGTYAPSNDSHSDESTSTNGEDKPRTAFEDNEFFSQKKSIVKCLMAMHFQYRLFQLSSSYILKFDAMILQMKEKILRFHLLKNSKFTYQCHCKKQINAQWYCLPLIYMDN